LPDEELRLLVYLPKAMMQHPPHESTPAAMLQEIDCVTPRPDSIRGDDTMVSASLESIAGVFRDFLAVKELDPDRISVIDGFFFLFNEPDFSRWHTLNWWEQRRQIQAIKDHPSYIERARVLLAQSRLAPYIDYADDLVAKSSDPEVKRAWMRKRLVLQECFWNALDTISHAAYFQNKYQEMFPALCLLLISVSGKHGRKDELVLGIDNGTGYLYKKKSRESGLFRLIYKSYKFFFKKGVFYIGGLELGLLETESELSCHGSGAVVYQGW
jgi:hypothetical protein